MDLISGLRQEKMTLPHACLILYCRGTGERLSFLSQEQHVGDCDFPVMLYRLNVTVL
jgi:hypothetical protein